MFAAVLSPAQQIEVIVIRGEQLPKILSQSMADYSVMAVAGDRLAPIPFQFDDVNEHGFLYAPGGILKVAGTADIFESQDQLAFMLKDTGIQATPAILQTVSGEVVSEIVLGEAEHARYAYLVAGNAERSEKTYTHFDRETGLIKTTSYSLQVDPDNLLVWGDAKFNSFAENRTILDTMKIKIIAKLGPVKATLNNKLIPNEIVAVKNGPVRTIIEMDADISILGINLVGAGASVTITENTLQVPVFATR